MTAVPPHSPDPPSDETFGKPYALVVLLQLHWFIRLRWLFAMGALTVLAVERFVLPEAERPALLLIVVLAVGGTNVLWTLVSRLLRRQLGDPGGDQNVAIRSGQFFASAQIATDLLLLTWILGLTGGIENPMSVFYLFHVAITGLLLRTWQAALLSLWAALLYATMGYGHTFGWWPHYPFLPHLGSSQLHTELHYVTLTVIVVACAIFGTLYFTDRIGKILDEREDRLIKTNAALARSRQAIQDLQLRRSRFMQIAAHQLKSPLAMVQTLANLILDGIVTDSAGIRATCEKIVRRARDGVSQVSELLALARVQEADPRRHQQAASDVAEVVDELCRRHQSVAEGKQITMSWQIPECDDLVAHVAEADLVDCVGNLIDNAIKYTPEGGSVHIRVLCGRKTPVKDDLPPPPAKTLGDRSVDDFVYVIVKDTGIGMSESLPFVRRGATTDGSVFDAFRRGETALSAGIPGTGLGLSIVREVVEQAGGYIHVYSRKGEGSTFSVCFPACYSTSAVTVRNTRSSHIDVGSGAPQPDDAR